MPNATRRPARATRAAKAKADPQHLKDALRGYLAALPPDVRKILEGMRKAVRAAAPKATEAFSYGIPGFKLDGKPLVWCAAWKAHVSLYPVGPAQIKAAGIDPDAYETAKGTIRFPLSKPPSAALVKRPVKARMPELALMKR
ncbi:MAG: DUF1801 domain-containing protein [Vicinamibacteria bacterium]